MSDLDNELLGLVNDDSESDSEVDDLDKLDQTQTLRDPSPEAKEKKRDDAPAKAQRGVAQKVKARGRRRRKQEESEDEGEASSSPAQSPASAMDDEHDDAPHEYADDDEQALFPVEGKFTSSADRDRILALPEIEREEILAERAMQITRRTQDLVLKKALATSGEAAAAAAKKRKATTAELDDGSTRSTRPKTDKRTAALDNLKRAREQKGAERDRRDAGRSRRDEREEERSRSRSRSRDAESDNERVVWAETEKRGGDRDEPPAELRDFERCRVGRSNFAKVCFYPGFEDAIKGCFARVSIGLNRETGQNQYRMTQITSFTEGKPYQMEMPNGKHFTTDQYAIVAHGNAEKAWPFHACSDGKFTEDEFRRFLQSLSKDNIRPSSRKELGQKVNDIHDLLNQHFTEESLQQKFAKQRAMELKYDPIHAARQKRKDINRRREDAEANGDEEEIVRCDAELEALDNAAANGAAKPKSSSAAAPKPLTQHERLAQLNQTNRSKNQQEVRKALIEERRKLEREREALRDKKTLALKAGLEAGVKAKQDAQRSAMKDMFGEADTDGSRAATPASSTPKKSGAGLAVRKGPVGALKVKELDDDVIGSLDLGIDEIEI